MSKWLDKKNTILVDISPEIPLDYGKKQAQKNREKFEKELFKEDDEELKPEFIEEMKNVEKEKAFLINDLNILFK